MGDWTRQGKKDHPIYNPGECEIISEAIFMAVKNIFAVAEATSTELHILYRHTIRKGKIHSWEYTGSDIN